MQRQCPDVHTWVREQKCRMGANGRAVGLRFNTQAAPWVQDTWIHEVRAYHENMFGVDGALLSLMVQPVRQLRTNAELFSAVVHGLGVRKVSMWSLGRMEWLAFELVAQALQVLRDRANNEEDEFWRAIETHLSRGRTDINLSIAFAPHKMQLVGEELEASAAGAGERADVILLAWPKGAEEPTALGWAYHTTNVPRGTASMRPGQQYPESRILWRQCVSLPNLMTQAATAVAGEAELASPEDPRTLPDAATWLGAFSTTTDEDEQMSDASVDFSDQLSDTSVDYGES